MPPTTIGERNPEQQLRLRPALVAAGLLLFARFGLPAIIPSTTIYGILAELVFGLFVLVWWAFFSRVPRAERWGALALIVVAVLATLAILDKSIAAPLFFIGSLPLLSVAIVLWAVASRTLGARARWASLAATILIASGAWALLRIDGVNGDAGMQMAWRWTRTPEQRLLARADVEPAPLPVSPAVNTTRPAENPPAPKEAPTTIAATIPAPRTPVRTSAEWPGFRGPHRDGVVTGLRIKTDWTATPPVELWRRPVGPGWSSFAVGGGLIYTQEQRGDFEVVACYDAATGKPVWAHRDAARFWESVGGAGPRGTPMLHDGRIYALGATGVLNALDASSGAVLWTRNAASDTGAKLPGWGFSSSPLVVDDLVIVATSGRLAAYNLTTGAPRWNGQTGGGSYSSPHLITVGGVAQVVLLNGIGATSVAPADGKVLWKYAWEGSKIIQPAVIAEGALLISTGDLTGGLGVRRLAVVNGPGGWTAEEVWTSAGLKPYFNDMVVHDGYAFGFDGSILACIDLKDGKRKWKGGRYGHGQMLLLADQSLLLVVSEEGELVLVGATPDKFTEIARFPAMQDKTWNHPALARDLLLVRNGQEMVAFRLSRDGS